MIRLVRPDELQPPVDHCPGSPSGHLLLPDGRCSCCEPTRVPPGLVVTVVLGLVFVVVLAAAGLVDVLVQVLE
jgi:hypothetical protein